MEYTLASLYCAVATANEEFGFRTRAHFLAFCTLGCALLITSEPLWCQSPRPNAPRTTTKLHLLAVTDRVPQNFLGHQIEDIIRVIRASGHSRPKSEFETTEVYRSRGQEFIEQLPDLFIVLREGAGLDVAFDADLQKVTFRLVTQNRSLHEIEERADVIVLKTQLVSSRQYVGTNAFGVAVRVREQRFRDLGLSIVGDGLNGHFSIPMESDRAKDLKSHLRLLLKCRVDAPLVYTGTHYVKATISDPIEEYRESLFVDVEPTEVLLIDNRTGAVLKRFTEDDATRERIAAELRAREWQEKLRQEKERREELAERHLLETLKNTPVKPSVVSEVHPTYPSLARQARMQGTVRFNALVGKDGTVLELRLISGWPLLISAAQDAAKLWKFTPGSINDIAVEMWTVIDIPFQLAP